MHSQKLNLISVKNHYLSLQMPDDKVRYRVKAGDYLGKISRTYGVRVSDIKQVEWATQQ